MLALTDCITSVIISASAAWTLESQDPFSIMPHCNPERQSIFYLLIAGKISSEVMGIWVLTLDTDIANDLVSL